MPARHHNRRTVLAGLGALAASPLAKPALAQGYPNRPIKVIVPFAAGGPTDVVARILGEHMSRTLGQQLVIENVAGAGGTTGMTRVTTSDADGYTVGVGHLGTQAAAPALYPQLKYDPVASFDQIGICNFTPQCIVSRKDLPATTLKDFVEYAKREGDKLTYAHAGIGSISHVSGVVFNGLFGLKPQMVAYRGTGPAMNDIVAGKIDYVVDQSLNVIPQIKGGTVKAFAVAAPERLSSIADIPTTKEAGIDFIFQAWNAMVAPKGIPADARARLVDALAKAHQDPAIRARFTELGSTAPRGDTSGPDGLLRFVTAEVARITPILKAAGITAQ
jgi:tripartite-type tricarboxylate transporter receptor subunit TctC